MIMVANMQKATDYLGVFLIISAFIYSSSVTYLPKLPTIPLIFFELLLLAVCEFGPLSSFISRKLVHSLSGLMMLHLDQEDDLARYFVYSVVISSLAMVWNVVGLFTNKWNFRFRYSTPKDVGISVYLVIVMIFFMRRIPLEIIKPVLFSDPLGAVIGKELTKNGVYNPRWIGEKTFGGSLAVFISTLFTLIYGGWMEKIIISFLVTVVEGLSKQYDNLFITFVVLLGYAIIK